MTIYEIAWYFFIYAFLGWCTEVSFFAVKKGKFVNRGFLNGPVCPVYGFGLVAVIAALTPLKDNLLLLFLGSVLITSALEFLTGWALEKIFHTRWWDYTENKFNLCGYICLEFSLIWGLAATAVMKIIQPLIQTAVGIIPQAAGWVLLGVFAAVILCDLAATVTTIHNMQKNLRALTAMAAEMHEISDKIGENISEKVLDIRGQGDDTKERYAGFADMCRSWYGFTEQELLDEYEGWKVYIRSHVPDPFPGIERVIRRQKELGGKICVVSHSCEENITRDYQTHFGLNPDDIFGWDLPEALRKPNPYPLRQIMEKYHCPSEEMLVVDDMKLACTMAEQVGVSVAFAGWGRKDCPELSEQMRGLCQFSFESPRELENFLFDDLTGVI